MNYCRETEEDIRRKYIDPALEKAGWKYEMIRAEFTITDGKINVQGVKGKREDRLKADYMLMYPQEYPIAIIEAKSSKYPVAKGIQQAIKYAEKLDVPFAYSSNGTAFFEHDFTTGEERVVFRRVSNSTRAMGTLQKVKTN